MRRKRLTLWGALMIARGQMKKIRVDEVKQYGQYFSEASFQEKLRMVGRGLGENILLPVLKAYLVLKSPTTSSKDKLFLLGALGYFVLPLDFLPDFLPGLFGFSDDIVVIGLIMSHIKANVTPEIELKAMNLYSSIMAPCMRQRAVVSRR